MSQPAEPVSSSAPPLVDQPADSAAAPLKPLLNPLQNGSPAVSTIAEPPRSPNAQNPATDNVGNNNEVDYPSASNSVVGPGEVVGDVGGDPAPTSNGDSASVPVDETQPAAVTDAPAPVTEESGPPPLPKDAPVPPTPPQPADEPVPTLPDGAIPPAVSTPTVITTETPAAPESTPAAETAPASESTPASAPAAAQAPPAPTPAQANGNPVAESQPASLPTPSATPGLGESVAPGTVSQPSQTPSVPASDAMEVDPPAYSSPTSRPSEGSLKRAGEDDLPGREEKRVKEESAAPAIAAVEPSPAAPVEAASTQPASAQPASTPVIPGLALDPNAPPPPWVNYVEPAPRPSGPTTPLTPTQHKHLLATVRALKKNKDAVNFLNPVDVHLFGIPHYAQIILKPMDLGTVEQKLIVSDPRGQPKDKSKMKNWDESKGKYENVSQVVQDIRQIWENTRKFNGPSHVVSLQAAKLDDVFEKGFKNMPAEPIVSAPLPPPSPAAPSPAGPSTHTRRPSISQVPVPRRSSDGPDSSRPKREIHPPPSKDLGYNDGMTRKPKRRNDPQLQWGLRTLKSFEAPKTFQIVSPFLYPVEDIIAALPTYADLIKQPIDLLKIKKKLEDGEYDEFPQLDADVKLMIRNAQYFNPPTEPVHQYAVELSGLWMDKVKNLPPKEAPRDVSEDPLNDDLIEEGSDEEDATRLYKLEEQLMTIQAQIADIKARRATRKARGPVKKAKKGGRKQSVSKMSPGLGTNGNSQAKKPRKSKDVSYRDDDDDSDDDGQISLAQKQELAEKMGSTDAETLNKAITIIQQTTDIGSNNEEIELDIDSLPPRTILKLYNLVVRGGRKAPKNKNAPLKKTGRKATGGANRKYMNEEEEADRIRRMEQQLQTYTGDRAGPAAGAGGAAGGYGYDEDGDDSSEEESSDED